MNIFVLDSDPQHAAQYHCDKHVVKMIVESCQIMCSVHHLFGVYSGIPYRKTHQFHPCVIWALQSRRNFEWLTELSQYLLLEYTFRYGKVHKSTQVYNWIVEHPLCFSVQELTSFVQVMPEPYKSLDAIAAYRNYYRGEKTTILKYTLREVPLWLNGYL